ncbi:MAG: PLP-dependent aminotransferase family protein [Leptospiraceae bacterium]|nr:PLP-dependent aminotransferase family protein [Leptospiraceae bacterium]
MAILFCSMPVSYQSYLAEYPQKYRAIYQALKDAILSGRLPHGTRLPSSREYALQLGVSRGTINQVYDMLAANGYLDTRRGSGSRITYRSEPVGVHARIATPDLSEWGRRLRSLSDDSNVQPEQACVNFVPGHPNPALFPRSDWDRCLRRAIRELQPEQNLPIGGYLPLREAIAAHLQRHRGLYAHPGEIMIMNGSMQAIFILCHLLLGPGRQAVLESPGYPGTRRAIELTGASIEYSPVDAEGMTGWQSKARLTFITPGRQFPTGVTLSYERRMRYIELAERDNTFLVEDDYDCEFRRSGRAQEPLHVLAPHRVVHLGSFSATLTPALRIGYAVLPESLRPLFERARQIMEQRPAGRLEQMALAEFIARGHYERYLRRTTRLIAARQRVFIESMQAGFPGKFHWITGDTGLTVFGHWQAGRRIMRNWVRACAAERIYIQPADRYHFIKSKPGAVFSLSHIEAADIPARVQQMKNLLDGCTQPN